MTDYDLEASFMEVSQGRIFVVSRIPKGDKRDLGIVIVPPFAEEMNNARHVLASLADVLARQGFCVLQPDLYGTGDSEGAFSQASWDGWVEQVKACQAFLRQSFGLGKCAVVCLRSGALLVAEMLRNGGESLESLVLWQPVLAGEAFLNNLLRLRVVSSMLTGTEKESIKHLKQSLLEGDEVEVGGYAINSRLAYGLVNVSLNAVDGRYLPRTCWMEIGARERAEFQPAIAQVVETWRGQGAAISYCSIDGEMFWALPGCSINDELIRQTVQFLAGGQA